MDPDQGRLAVSGLIRYRGRAYAAGKERHVQSSELAGGPKFHSSTVTVTSIVTVAVPSP